GCFIILPFQAIGFVNDGEGTIVSKQLVIEVSPHKRCFPDQAIHNAVGIFELRLTQLLDGKVGGTDTGIHISPGTGSADPSWIGSIGTCFSHGGDISTRVGKNGFVCKGGQHLFCKTSLFQTCINFRYKGLCKGGIRPNYGFGYLSKGLCVEELVATAADQK